MKNVASDIGILKYQHQPHHTYVREVCGMVGVAHPQKTRDALQGAQCDRHGELNWVGVKNGEKSQIQ